MEKYLQKLKNKENLNFEESKSAFEMLMSGNLDEEKIYSFLTLSSEKGETSDEVAGGVYVLRNKATQVKYQMILLILVEQEEMERTH